MAKKGVLTKKGDTRYPHTLVSAVHDDNDMSRTLDVILKEKQNVLVSGKTIKTLNFLSLLGAGNIQLKTINGQSLIVDGDESSDTDILIEAGSGCECEPMEAIDASNCFITQDLTAGHSIGGISAGKVYPKGTSIQQILIDMFYKAPAAPTYTKPSVSLSVTSSAEYGSKFSTLTITITLSQNDGGKFATSGTLTILRPDGTKFKDITFTVGADGKVTIPVFADTDLLDAIGDWKFSVSVDYSANAEGTVKAGTATASTSNPTVYAVVYYGPFGTEADAAPERIFTAAEVASLPYSVNVSASGSFTIDTSKSVGGKVPTGCTVLFAYPSELISSLSFTLLKEGTQDTTGTWNSDSNSANIRHTASGKHNGLTYYVKGRRGTSDFNVVSGTMAITVK